MKIANKLVSIEIWIVAASVFISMVFTRALPWAFGVGLIFWLVRWIAGRRFSIRTPVDLGIILLLLLIPVTLWITAIPSKTLPQVYRLLTGVVLFYAIVNWTSTYIRFRWVVVCTILASFFLALFSMISVEWIDVAWAQQKLPFIPASFYDHFMLLVADTVHRNVMAGILIILFPVSLGLLLFSWKDLRGWYRLLLLIVACTVFGILILTQSRGAFVALAVVIITLIVLRWRWGWISIPLSFMAVGGIIGLRGVDTFLGVLASGVSLGGLAGRLEVWSRAIYMIQDFPFTGVGIGLFGDVVDNLYPLFQYSSGTIPHAHNLFLQIAVDMGLPGLIAWTSILLVVIVSSWNIYRVGRRQSNFWFMGLGAGFLGTQIALLVHGIFDAVTWGMVRPAPILWALWGIIIACSIHVESWCDSDRVPKRI